MGQHRLQYRNRFGKLAAALLAGALVVALLGSARLEALAAQWQLNLASLDVLGALLEDRAPGPAGAGINWSGSCVDYMAAAGALRTPEFQDLAPEQRLRLLDQLAACWPPGRRALLMDRISEAQWALGRYQDVCNTFVEMEAPGRLLSLARESADSGNWTAVAATLECVKRFSPEGTWVSPFIVAELYHSLGQHYEGSGEIERAVAAYDAAAQRYPVVWAAPYTKKAALLWQQGARQEAIRWLVDGVSRSTDVTATFYLWRELGGYWQQQGEMENAACAYHNAAQTIDLVPPQNVTEADREQLAAQIRLLGPALLEACFGQYPELRTSQPGG